MDPTAGHAILRSGQKLDLVPGCEASDLLTFYSFNPDYEPRDPPTPRRYIDLTELKGTNKERSKEALENDCDKIIAEHFSPREFFFATDPIVNSFMVHDPLKRELGLFFIFTEFNTL